MVFSTQGSYRLTKSSLRWFIIGTYMARVTLSGTFVGPGSITRYSNMPIPATPGVIYKVRG